MMKASTIVVTAAFVALAAPAAAQQGVDWQYPAVQDYGPVVPVPDASAKMDQDGGYKVVFNVTEGRPGDGRVSSSLALVVRFVNLL